MTVTLTYDTLLSRVQISCDGLGAAIEALVERSTDEVTWITVRGGIDVPITAGAFGLPVNDYEFAPNVQNFYRITPNSGSVQSNSITPNLTETWLKSIARPFLNMSFAQSEIVSPVDRASRDGLFDVIGRSLPIGVSDIRSSRQYDLRLVSSDFDAGSALDLLLLTGDILYLHVPPTWPHKSAYIQVRGMPREFRWSTEWSIWTLSVREVAALGPDVIGSTSTYQTVLNEHPDYQDVLTMHPTYSDILTMLADSDEVIVP